MRANTRSNGVRRRRRRRFWTHAEQDMGRFWCYACKRLVHRAHLDIPHGKSAGQLYLDSAAEYERLVAAGESVFRSAPTTLQIRLSTLVRLLN